MKLHLQKLFIVHRPNGKFLFAEVRSVCGKSRKGLKFTISRSKTTCKTCRKLTR